MSSVASRIRQHWDTDFAQSETQVEAYLDALTQLEGLSLAYIVHAFQRLGLIFTPGERFTPAELGARLHVSDSHRLLFARLLEILAEEGILRPIDTAWEVIQTPETADLPGLEQRFAEQYSHADAELTLLRRCGSNLAQVLCGECNSLELLFPGGNPADATRLYQDSICAQMMNRLAAQAVEAIAQHLPTNRKLRVLEIGAGTGGTTTYLLSKLPAEQTEYVFSDLSPWLLMQAKVRFQKYPFVKYQALNIEQQPDTKGEKQPQYDLVIAANVLHATCDLRESLRHIHQYLAPGGWVILLELTGQQRWLDLIFGLTPGWWRFGDYDVRPAYPLVSEHRWELLLEEAGFAEILTMPTGKDGAIASRQTILAARSSLRAPTTEAQRQLWLAAQLGDEGSLAYNVSLGLELTGQLNLAAMRRTIHKLVARHEALRTTISHQGDFQIILPDLDLEIPLVDFSEQDEAGRLASAKSWLQTESQQPFDLERGPLFRAAILKLTEQQHVVVLSAHHIVTDGWSLGILVQELSVIYSAECQQAEPKLVEPWQFREYEQWQEQQKKTPAMQAHETYWLSLLREPIPTLDLPTDRPRPAAKTYRGARETIYMDTNLTDALKKLSRQAGATLFMTLLGSFSAFLHRISGQNDILLGFPVSGRPLQGTSRLVGYCTHIAPYRSILPVGITFTHYLEATKAILLKAYQHQDYPFARLLQRLQLRHDASRAPLVGLTFNLDHPVTIPKMFGLEADLFPQPISFTGFDMSINIIMINEGLTVDCNYNTDLFDAATVARWLRCFASLLDAVIANPDQRVEQIPLLTADEQQQQLFCWNATQSGYPDQQGIADLFEAQAAKTPDLVAVVLDEDRLTYRELDQRANQMAHYLQSQGVGAESLVGIGLQRSLEMIIGLVGILKAGAAYVPLDLSYPKERLQWLIQDTGISLVLTRQQDAEVLSSETLRLIYLDGDWAQISSFPHTPPARKNDPLQLAYVMYTSGSTGLPKGIAIPQCAVVRLVKNTSFARLDETETFLQFAPISFDASTLEIWGPLLNGGRLVIFPARPASLTELAEVIRRDKITTLWLTAGLFHLMVDEKLEDLSAVRQLLAGGDVLSPTHVQKVLQAMPPGSALINGYGPTENTTFTCCYSMRSGDVVAQAVPIGFPIANTTVYILDHNFQPVPVGVLGELFIGGDGLARGYINRPELTAEKFIPHPFSRAPGERLYRSGDVARYLPDGSIEFLGRRDHQVKIRGFRIELEEIEMALGQAPGVRDAVVNVVQMEGQDKRLVGYMVLAPEQQPIPVNDLRSFLAERLPDYMVPGAFVFLDSLPLNPNGKVDRRALPMPTESAAQAVYVAPQSDTEQLIAQIWQRVLKVEKVGLTDNFFDIGGHSLHMVQVHEELQKSIRRDVPIVELFHYPSIETLARYLSQAPEQTLSAEKVQDRAQKQARAFGQQKKLTLKKGNTPND